MASWSKLKDSGTQILVVCFATSVVRVAEIPQLSAVVQIHDVTVLWSGLLKAADCLEKSS